ncbi:MAG: hypothetical protein ACLQLG_11325 [Thermoguttaceae bacterium]
MTAANHLKLHNPIHAEPAAVLTRLLRILCRSLPMYLRDARPWSAVEGDPALAALAALVADQERFACRTAQAILDLGGQPEPGPFPMEFASINDASLDYLLGQVIESLHRDLPRIERCAAELADFPALCALAEEALGNAQAHLDILERIVAQRGGQAGD